MLSRSSWLHLRIPFSFFLLPIFFFALGLSPNLNQSRMLWVLAIVHLFLYPASNGFNSYFDKDEKSIGGIKNPPPVNKGLYFLSLLFDGVAIILGWLKVGILFSLMLLVYGLVSKAYSHPMVRLKKYAWLGWFVTGLFQGFFIVITCFVGLNDFDLVTTLNAKVLLAGVLASLMLWGNYPMTQIYQHDEDAKRGDITLSIKLGIMGTFYFVAIAFGIATVGFILFFNAFFEGKYINSFLICMCPVVVYFGYWFLIVYRDREKADYAHTMALNFISALCLNGFFIYFFLDNSNVMNFISQ